MMLIWFGLSVFLLCLAKVFVIDPLHHWVAAKFGKKYDPSKMEYY